MKKGIIRNKKESCVFVVWFQNRENTRLLICKEALERMLKRKGIQSVAAYRIVLCNACANRCQQYFAGAAVHIDKAFSGGGGADQGFAGALYGEA